MTMEKVISTFHSQQGFPNPMETGNSLHSFLEKHCPEQNYIQINLFIM